MIELHEQIKIKQNLIKLKEGSDGSISVQS